ncbi:MAG: hypothetical protein ABSE73_00740 [Planctomycetota bacterium]
MNEKECSEVFAELMKMLRQREFGWVAQQVEEAIGVRRQLEKNSATVVAKKSLSETGDTESYRKGPHAAYSYTEPYNANEKLGILLSAIEHAVVHPFQMQMHTFSVFGRAKTPLSEVRFVNDDQKAPILVLRESEMKTRIESIRLLSDAISCLRKEL